MAAELLLVAERRRLPGPDVLYAGAVDQPPAGTELCQFVRENGTLRPKPRAVPAAERPPAGSLRRSVTG